ncbi:MAG: radical SAM protein, partial [Candidatus Aenigmatarchaeota archaeon]
GGEPLLFEDIYELVKFGKKLGVNITLGTNGTLLNEEVVRKLRYSKIDKVFVSLDHWEKEKHEWLRGESVFEKTINGIELLKKYGIRVRIDSIIWKQNYDAIEKLVEFCEKLNVDEVMFAWPVKVGLAEKNYFQIFPPKEEYFSIGKKLKTIQKCSKVKVSYHRFKYFSKNCKDCPGGEKIFYINPEGRVSPCFWISCLLDLFSEKTVFEEKFLRLINDKSLEYFRKEKRKRYKQFGPGCPAICIIENGNLYSKDPLLHAHS